MKTNFEKVNDFNTCFGHFITDQKNTNIFSENPKLVELKFSLINEEVGELRDALIENDIKEIIDALCDIEYVVNGLAGAFGFNIDRELRNFILRENENFNGQAEKLFKDIQNKKVKLNISNVPWCQHKIEICSIIENLDISNFEAISFLNKFYYEKSNRSAYSPHSSLFSDKEEIKKYKENWDSRKFYGYKYYLNDSVEFYKNLKNKEFREYLNLKWFDICHTNESLKLFIEQEKFEESQEMAVKLLFHVLMMALLIGYNHDEAFNIVHTSNMTKICGNEADAKKTVEWYKEHNNKYKTPAYKKNEFGYVIFNQDTNKVLKSIYYTPASFNKFLKQNSGNVDELDIKTRWIVV